MTCENPRAFCDTNDSREQHWRDHVHRCGAYRLWYRRTDGQHWLTIVVPSRLSTAIDLRHVMKPRHPATHQIELRLVTLSQLFNSMDPTPFHHRDLDRDAVEFLESWALEFPQGSHFRIIVHIEKMPPEDPSPLVAEAMHNYFEYEAMLAK